MIEEDQITFWWVAKLSWPIAFLHTGAMALLIWLMSLWPGVDPFMVFLGGWLAGGATMTSGLKRLLYEAFPEFRDNES